VVWEAKNERGGFRSQYPSSDLASFQTGTTSSRFHHLPVVPQIGDQALDTGRGEHLRSQPKHMVPAWRVYNEDKPFVEGGVEVRLTANNPAHVPS
jgi:hypothetical protein